MLADDVAANRAIGAFGADALCAAVGKAPGASLRVLTHCNTGSLATAGYGTALGVVRAPRERPSRTHLLQRDAPVQPGRAAHRVRDCVREDAGRHLRLRRGEPDRQKGGRRWWAPTASPTTETPRTKSVPTTWRSPARTTACRFSSPRPCPRWIRARRRGATSSSRTAPRRRSRTSGGAAPPPTASASGTPPSTSPPGA